MMTDSTLAPQRTKLDPPIGFDFEGWPAILIALGEDTAVIHIEYENVEVPVARLPENIRQMAREQSSG